MQSINVMREHCTGCGNCSFVCKEAAIKMKKNSEGHIYPYIESDRCVLCGECLTACPLTATAKRKREGIQYYYVADNFVRWESADGGALVTLINEFICIGGAVCAPVFSEDYCSVKHEFINTAEEACLFGYVQSDAYRIYDDIRIRLCNQQKLLFIGTPCEVAGLKAYIMEEKENLYLVALECSGKASSLMWGKFVESVGHKILSIKLHSKEFGCVDSIKLFHRLGICEQDGSGIWISLFNTGVLCRKSCLNCGFSSGNVSCDLWLERGAYDDAENDGKGLSYIEVLSDKGMYLCSIIEKQAKRFEVVATKKILKAGLKNIHEEAFINKRQQFFYDVMDCGFETACENIKSNTKVSAVKYVLDYYVENSKWIFTNSEVWQQRLYDGYIMLFTNGQPMERAFLALDNKLSVGKKYNMMMKYKASSLAGIRILFSNEASKKAKAIAFERLTASEQWKIERFTFQCNEENMGYVFFTSSDVSGKDNMLCFDWIRIWER